MVGEKIAVWFVRIIVVENDMNMNMNIKKKHQKCRPCHDDKKKKICDAEGNDGWCEA